MGNVVRPGLLLLLFVFVCVCSTSRSWKNKWTLTTENLFFPDAHLIIDQPMLLELITELNEVFTYGLHPIPTE